jgi:superfamily II DNA/RNA helicase
MLPKARQTLFFSATMPQQIVQLAAFMFRDPARVAVTPQATTAERVDQRVILTDKASKPALLAEVLKGENIDRVLVFTRTKHGADKVVRGLHKAGHTAEAIHGNKSQSQRERVLAAFRDGKLRTLIATDIAARGIDVDGVSHVVNYDLPNIPESYVHRIGRTARAGAEGIAISFCDHGRAYLRDIERLIRMIFRQPTGAPASVLIGTAACRDPCQPPAASAPTRSADGTVASGQRPALHPAGMAQGRAGHNGHQPPVRQDAAAGEPSGIGNVTFLKRPGEPRRNAGHRVPR